MHETFWLATNARTPSRQSGRPGAGRHEYEGGKQARESVCVKRVYLVSRLSEERGGCIGTKEGAWPPSQACRQALDRSVAHIAERRAGLRFSQRSLDVKKNTVSNFKRVWSQLPFRSRLEDFAQGQVELSSARTAGDPAGRRQDRKLEAAQVASYKKKSKDLALTSSSSMRAVSCSFRHVGAPGGRKDTHPLPGTITNMIGFRRLVRSRCPQSRNAWASIYVFRKRTSTLGTPRISCACSCATYTARWSSSGTTGESIAGLLFGSFKDNTLVFMWSTSPATQRSSTLWSGYGPIVRLIWVTCCYSILPHYDGSCIGTSAAFRPHSKCCVRSSKAQSSRRRPGRRSITYANLNSRVP